MEKEKLEQLKKRLEEIVGARHVLFNAEDLYCYGMVKAQIDG